METTFAVPFDPGQYPRVYRASRGYLIFLGLCGLLITVGACLGAWYFGTGHEMDSPRQAMIAVLICFAFVLLGIGNLAMIFRYKVTLRPEAIVVRSTFSSRTLLRADIAGHRILPTQYVSTLVLIPQTEHQKKLKVALLLSRDAEFNAWLAGIPDLDAQELAASEKKLVADPDLGFTSDDRSRQIATARRIAKPLNAVALASMLWAIWFPRAYSLLISVLAILPFVALVLLVQSRGIYQVEGRRNDARPSLALVLIGPSLGLALRAMLDFNLLEWKAILFITILISLVMTAAVAASDPATRKRPVAVVLMFLFTAVYGYGLSVEANAMLDHSPAQIYRVAVVDKHVSEGKSTTYYLHIEPWGSQTGVTEVSVPSSLYDAASRGSTVCVYLHAGALKVPWYVVDQCS